MKDYLEWQLVHCKCGSTASTGGGTKCGTGKGIHKTDKQEYILLIIHM
jgi:hypothetical protein